MRPRPYRSVSFHVLLPNSTVLTRSLGLVRDQFCYFVLTRSNLFDPVEPISEWGEKDSNLRPTDYESRRNPSIEPNLAW